MNRIKNRHLIRRQLAYIFPAVLYTLWQACTGWLNTYWTLEKLGNDFTTLNYVLFFFAHAAATAAFALRLDRPCSTKLLKGLMLLSTLLTGLLTASMAFADGFWFILSGICSGIFAGFLTAFLTFYIFLSIPAKVRGITFGISSAAGIAVHFVIFTLLFPQQTGMVLYAKTFFAASVILLLGIISLLLPVCRENLWDENKALPNESTVLETSRPRLLPLMVLILLCFFMSYGIQDFAATSYWMNGNGFLVHTRLFLIAGFLLGGFMWDRNIRNILLSGSFGLLAMGFVSMARGYEGAASFIGFSGVQLASAFFSLSVRLIFLDIARFYKRPAFICSLGLALPLILKQAGIFSAGVFYAAFGGTSIFIASLVLIAGGIPFVTLLFEKIRDMNVLDIRRHTTIAGPPESWESDVGELEKSIQEDFAAANLKEEMFNNLILKYEFNRRETQILELSLRGLSISQMAQSLGISESTVKHYIRRILTKTGTKNQKQLLLLAINENAGV